MAHSSPLPFNKESLVLALNTFFTTKQAEVDDKLASYQIAEGFGGKVPYWQESTRCLRFQTTKVEGLLYRPKIVLDIMTEITGALRKGGGVIVQGPHGVGKSHSLVNVVRKLLSTGDYLVTFLPDCQKWDSFWHLCVVMCQSMGSSMEGLDFRPDLTNNETMRRDFHYFVDAVDEILKSKEKQWVFVFDQVNRLFLDLPNVTDVGALPFPFKYMTNIILRDRRTSIISSSANNETAFPGNAEWFIPFNHPPAMELEELPLAFPELHTKSEADLKKLKEITGGVPWQIQRRLNLELEKIP